MHNQYYFVFVKQTLVAVLSVLVAAFYFDKMPFRTHRMVPTFVNANSPPQLKAAILPQLVTIHPNNFFFSVQRCHFTFKTLTLKTLRLFFAYFQQLRTHSQIEMLLPSHERNNLASLLRTTGRGKENNRHFATIIRTEDRRLVTMDCDYEAGGSATLVF